MKQGWEINKLGEVCDIVGGSTPKTGESSYWDGEHFWVTPAELDGAKYISSTSRTITDAGVKSAHLQLLPSGTVLLSSRAPIGKVAITTTPMYCNQGFKNLVCSNKLKNEYAYWFLYFNTEYLNSLGTGATFKEISKRVVEQITIPVPPIEEQERIVVELDCLSGVIEKKREQLRELDALAQSIFYQMFGDPITNEKGWEVKKLKNITSKIGSGATPKGGNESYKGEGISLIRSLNIHNNIFVYKDLAHIDEEQADALRNVVVEDGDVLLNITGASVARCCVVPNDVLPARVNQHVAIIRPKELGNNIFICYQFTSNAYQQELLSIGKSNGATREALTKRQLEELDIIVPPLTLQQEFADKIEAIEKQKALIKQSITQTEELFNARMDYYFN